MLNYRCLVVLRTDCKIKKMAEKQHNYMKYINKVKFIEIIDIMLSFYAILTPCNRLHGHFEAELGGCMACNLVAWRATEVILDHFNPKMRLHEVARGGCMACNLVASRATGSIQPQSLHSLGRATHSGGVAASF